MLDWYFPFTQPTSYPGTLSTTFASALLAILVPYLHIHIAEPFSSTHTSQSIYPGTCASVSNLATNMFMGTLFQQHTNQLLPHNDLAASIGMSIERLKVSSCSRKYFCTHTVKYLFTTEMKTSNVSGKTTGAITKSR